MPFARTTLEALLERLAAAYGSQHWWPAETGFEVMVGAVLTQSTAWSNAGKAVANLRVADCLDAAAILGLARGELERLLRPAGFYRVKSQCLVNLCQWLVHAGGMARAEAMSTPALRRALLGVKGIGAETADAILLYAFARPVFVVDAYARRILSRYGLASGRESYAELQHELQRALGAGAPAYNEYHALMVQHAKVHCRTTPRCASCPLTDSCALPRRAVASEIDLAQQRR